MKTLALLVSFYFFINLTMLNAQTSQGKILVGASSTLSFIGTGTDFFTIGYMSAKYKSDVDEFDESDQNLILNLSPKVGYFVIDNLALGLDVTLSLSNSNNGGGEYESNTIFGTGPFIRYYIPTSKVLPFFEVNSIFGTSKSKKGTYEYKSSIFSIGGGIGAAVPLGDKVIFDVLAGYNSMTIKNKKYNPYNGRAIVGTIGLKFGFIILLGSN